MTPSFSTAWCTCVIGLLPLSLFAANSDYRLADAAKNQDKELIRSLLKSGAEVNGARGDGATALAWAAYWNDRETEQLLLRSGAKATAANAYGVTPLSLACENGNTAIVNDLLKAGANPNAPSQTGVTPLMLAARAGDYAEIAAALIAHHADANAKEKEWGQTALMWAVSRQHRAVVKTLLASGANVHARSLAGFTSLLFAARAGDLESAKMLLEAGADVNESTPEYGNALVLASASGHEALSIFLLDKGADANSADSKGITALHWAVQRGLESISGIEWQSARFGGHGGHIPLPSDMPELVKALLAHKANPNARIAKDYPLFFRAPARPSIWIAGATPFFLAAASDDVNLMRMLADSGADTHLTTDEHTTPLMAAAGVGRVESRPEEQEKAVIDAVKLTLELGGDVNAADDNGWTALHAAAYTGSDSLVRFLVEKGAKINVKNRIGQTPLAIAQGKPGSRSARPSDVPYMVHETTVKLLREMGAESSSAKTRGQNEAAAAAESKE
jgi:uncharacterized protein